MIAQGLPLDCFYQQERQQPDKTYLVQPHEGGAVERISWAQAGEQARRAANWLTELNLPPRSNIAIISKNCAHWIITDLAIWMAGHVSVPLYPNLTAESVRQVLEHADVPLVFVGKLDDWPAMAPGVADGVRTAALPLHPPGRFDALWEDLQACPPLKDCAQPKADDLATIIYTSGTTGMPKGVMHHFGNFAFAANNAIGLFGVAEHDRVLSYLPLCHVAERMFVEMTSFYTGLTVYFAQSLETFVQDMQRARPTIFFTVPRMLSQFHLGVLEKMPAKKLNFLLRLPLLGPRVGRKVLAGLGLDAIRYALCGAAPVPKELLSWYRRLGMDLQEVYGMTENCGYSHVCRPGHYQEGWIGQPSPGVEVRISEQGEVQVRSGATMQGYYKEPEKTAETLTVDGFLRTGDKGEQDSAGNLRLTGRLKEIFKTSKGKYVAPAPIENRLATHQRIEQVCVVGDGLAQPLALCVLSDAGRSEAQGADREALAGSFKRLLDEVNAELNQHERLDRLVLLGDQWTVENGFLTPTLKIKRSVVEGTYAKRFPAWLAQKEPLLWHREQEIS